MSVAVPEYAGGGVHVAFTLLADGLKLPPIPPSLQVPPVALPPAEPPRADVVPALQMAGMAGPGLTVGSGFTTMIFDSKPVPQLLLADKVKVAVPVKFSGGVHVAVPGLLEEKVPPTLDVHFSVPAV